jgi:predicted transcriptional regulator
MQLLRAIRREAPGSLNRLAQLVGRDLENVQEDVRALAAHGLVSLKKDRSVSGRYVTVPRVKFREIEVRIEV